jgi:rRNA maturation protein Nop10
MRIADYILFDSLKTMSHKCVMGIPCVIEYPKGSLRELKNKAGDVVYRKRQFVHYGFIDDTVGRDGDEIDVLIGPLSSFANVYVIHMIDKGPDKDQREDEDKCMLGFDNPKSAKAAFLKHYPANFFGGMDIIPVADFKKKIKQDGKMLTAGGPGSGRHIMLYHGTSRKQHLDGIKAAGFNQVKPIVNKHKSIGRPEELLAKAGKGRFLTEKHMRALGRMAMAKEKCPKCGSTKYGLMPTDFETAKCSKCGKTWQAKNPPKP